MREIRGDTGTDSRHLQMLCHSQNAGGPEFKDPTLGFVYTSDEDADNKGALQNETCVVPTVVWGAAVLCNHRDRLRQPLRVGAALVKR